MTTKAGYYGSDAVENRFKDPKTNEAYFVLVNQKTGEMELYNEEFAADKRVGTINKDNTIDYNENWWGGANANDKAFAEKALGDGTIRTHAANMVRKDSTLTRAQVKDLTGGNASIKDASQVGLTAAERKKLDTLGADAIDNAAGTRNNFQGPDGPLIFPAAIAKSSQDIIQFNMMEYVSKGMGNTNKGKFNIGERNKNRKTIGRVILPIPAGIQDNNQVSWSEDKMNALDVELANIALEGIENLGAGVDAAVQAANKLAQNAGDVGIAVKTALAGEAIQKNNLLSRTTGAILNPNMELLFNAPMLRPFQFSFQLAPRNKAEAKTVISIIRFFKQGMAAIRTKSNLFLKSPHTFRLEYKYRGEGRNIEHPYLNKFKECALRGLTVNYTPNGNYSTLNDGVMMTYQIGMEFSELEPVFNDDYGMGYQNIGY